MTMTNVTRDERHMCKAPLTIVPRGTIHSPVYNPVDSLWITMAEPYRAWSEPVDNPPWLSGRAERGGGVNSGPTHHPPPQ
jgi:hypothetical protein